MVGMKKISTSKRMGWVCREAPKGFTVKVVEPSIDEGRCENCRTEMSTHLFNVGIQHHHLCKACFEGLVKALAGQGGFLLVNK